jgi:hypothetical protein
LKAIVSSSVSFFGSFQPVFYASFSALPTKKPEKRSFSPFFNWRSQFADGKSQSADGKLSPLTGNPSPLTGNRVPPTEKSVCRRAIENR